MTLPFMHVKLITRQRAHRSAAARGDESRARL
jgi:hypothetical protein